VGDMTKKIDTDIDAMPVLSACKLVMIKILNSIKSDAIQSVPYIVGPPGIGKSEILGQELKKHGFRHLPISVGLFRVERLSGIPDIKRIPYGDKEILTTEWSLPEVVSQLNMMTYVHNSDADKTVYEDNPDGHKKTIKYDDNGFALNVNNERIRVYVNCTMDDFHVAPPEIQNCGFETFTHRKISGHPVDKRVTFVLAGNDSISAGLKSYNSAIINRLWMIYTRPHVKDWFLGYASKQSDLDESIIGYLCNEAYSSMFLGEESKRTPWPSPRAWTNAARDMFYFKQNIKDGKFEFWKQEFLDNAYYQIISGHVGKEAASNFIIWDEIYKKINTKLIFDQNKVNLTDNPSENYAIGFASVYEFIQRIESPMYDNNTTIKTLIMIIEKLDDSGCGEIAIALLASLIQRNVRIGMIVMSAIKDSKKLKKLSEYTSYYG
jgi:hypothetical protein